MRGIKDGERSSPNHLHGQQVKGSPVLRTGAVVDGGYWERLLLAESMYTDRWGQTSTIGVYRDQQCCCEEQGQA